MSGVQRSYENSGEGRRGEENRTWGERVSLQALILVQASIYTEISVWELEY